MARELGPDNVRVTASPGLIQTDTAGKLTDEMTGQHPAGILM